MVLGQEEARQIAAEVGIRSLGTPAKVQLSSQGLQDAQDTLSQNYFGTPCPFLADGTCRIYASRPLACRLHFNVGHSPALCSISVRPEDSIVPNVDLTLFWGAVVMATGRSGVFGDIREYFPSGQPLR